MELFFEHGDLAEEAQEDKYLTFQVGEQHYGVSILNVSEIVPYQEPVRLPEVPHYIRGAINLRGNVVPLLDLRLRFGGPPQSCDERSCVVVTEVEGQVMGLIVYRVEEVVSIGPDSLSAPPDIPGDKAVRYILGFGSVGDGVVILLDCALILTAEDLSALGRITPDTLGL